MRLPIDTSRLQFLAVDTAEPQFQWEEGKPREAWAPRLDSNGEQLYRVQLVVMGDGQAGILRVGHVGDPSVTGGELVRVEGLTSQEWEKDGNRGVSYRAAAIRSAPARSEKAAA